MTPLKIINPLFFLSMILQVYTGISGQFFEVHEINGYILTALLIAHLAFNRTWIINTYFKKRK